MSLDVTLMCRCCKHELYSANITHNLGPMADMVGLYGPLWRPEEQGITCGAELAPLLTAGLRALKDSPTLYRTRNPENGWGKYENLVEFVHKYLNACIRFPDAVVDVSR